VGQSGLQVYRSALFNSCKVGWYRVWPVWIMHSFLMLLQNEKNGNVRGGGNGGRDPHGISKHVD